LDANPGGREAILVWRSCPLSTQTCHDRNRPIADISDIGEHRRMRIILLATALLSTGCVNKEREPIAFAFASGPSKSAEVIATAVATCRAPATVVTDGQRAMILLDQSRTEAAFNCLSQWVYNHPETGIEKVGFIGTEQAQ
jgi:hypothetical protein